MRMLRLVTRRVRKPFCPQAAELPGNGLKVHGQTIEVGGVAVAYPEGVRRKFSFLYRLSPVAGDVYRWDRVCVPVAGDCPLSLCGA